MRRNQDPTAPQRIKAAMRDIVQYFVTHGGMFTLMFLGFEPLLMLGNGGVAFSWSGLTLLYRCRTRGGFPTVKFVVNTYS